MNRTIFFKSHMSVAQKTRASGPYGDGFNYHVEVGIHSHPGLDEKQIVRQIASVTSVLDHKALGVDFDLGQEPTGVALFLWLEDKLKSTLGLAFATLKLERGDGHEFTSAN
jgi:hypothetical protein